MNQQDFSLQKQCAYNRIGIDKKINMVIRKELDNAIRHSEPYSKHWVEAHRLRSELNISEANGFVDRPVESNNKPNPIYRINGGRIICSPSNLSFQLKDKEGGIVGGGQLTLTELKLLNVLVKNQGNVVNYPTIESEVWGPDSHEVKPLIKKHVQRLRHKLEPGKEDPRHNSIFQNVSGIGYKMAVSVDVVDSTQKGNSVS